VINRAKPDMIRRGDMLSVNDVLDILSTPLLGVIPDDEQIIVSSNRGSPLTLDNQKTPASEAIRDIAKRITGAKVPMGELERKKGVLFRRLARLFRRSKA